MYEHHQLLIPHRNNSGVGGGHRLLVTDSLAPPPPPGALAVVSALPSHTNIYLQDNDDTEEDAATSSFSSTSGGSHNSRPPSLSLPATPEGNENEEVDCESALIEIEDDDDDDEESARAPIAASKTGPSSASKAFSADANKKSTTKKKKGLVNRRNRSRGYVHLTDEQNGYVDAVLAQEEALRHVRIVDTTVVAVGLLCLAPVLQAALVARTDDTNANTANWQFYQSVGTQCAIFAVAQVSLAILYDTHSALLSYVGRMTLTVKLLNWLWVMFVLALPIGSFLVGGGRSHFGFIVIILVARFVTTLMLWKVRSQPKTWKHDIAPRFPVMLRAFVDCALLVGALFMSLTTPGYLSALLLVAGPVVTRCLLVVFPGLSFD